MVNNNVPQFTTVCEIRQNDADPSDSDPLYIALNIWQKFVTCCFRMAISCRIVDRNGCNEYSVVANQVDAAVCRLFTLLLVAKRNICSWHKLSKLVFFFSSRWKNLSKLFMCWSSGVLHLKGQSHEIKVWFFGLKVQENSFNIPAEGF